LFSSHKLIKFQFCESPILETNVSELKNKVARIRVGVPGRDLFAESAANSWMQAISDVAAKLRSQIMSR
jgi:ribosome-associated translation inhibitor RaiA